MYSAVALAGVQLPVERVSVSPDRGGASGRIVGACVTVAASALVAASTAITTAIVSDDPPVLGPFCCSRLRHVVHLLVSLTNATDMVAPELSERCRIDTEILDQWSGSRTLRPALILLLHNRYRVPGGEERAVEDLAWLIREHLGEEVEVLERDSAALSPRARRPRGCCAAGSRPEEVGDAVRRTGARVVHAHNVNPTLGWRALAAARAAGARVVLHLHNYRLVCAVGTCFTHGRGLHALPRARHAARACG